MAYVKIIYQNSPSTATPINAQNLNHMDDGIAENDRRLNELETAGVVNKFNGRSGNVTPTKGDYDIADIGATDGQDGYVPVWRNSGTEEDPNWGFEMEQQGGSGHKILDADGSEMAQEDSLQFADSFVSDDDINGKTVVENIKEVLPADYDSTTDEGIIVCDDGEDAVIHPSSDDYVEVTASSDTYKTLLNKLRDAIDFDKVSQSSYIVSSQYDGYIYIASFINPTKTELQFNMINAYTTSLIETFYINKNSNCSARRCTIGNNTSSNADITGTSVTDGLKLTFYYGNKKAVVDLQTTANRCLMSDGNPISDLECDKTSAGTYALKCTVDAQGNKTYSWV